MHTYYIVSRLDNGCIYVPAVLKYLCTYKIILFNVVMCVHLGQERGAGFETTAERNARNGSFTYRGGILYHGWSLHSDMKLYVHN